MKVTGKQWTALGVIVAVILGIATIILEFPGFLTSAISLGWLSFRNTSPSYTSYGPKNVQEKRTDEINTFPAQAGDTDTPTSISTTADPGRRGSVTFTA